MPFKQFAVKVAFLRSGRVNGKTHSCPFHFGIADLRFGMVAQSVDPTVSNTIAELFLLSVQYMFRDVTLECLSDGCFLDASIAAHFSRGVESHGVINEFPI